jgi:hypothetical protein
MRSKLTPIYILLETIHRNPEESYTTPYDVYLHKEDAEFDKTSCEEDHETSMNDYEIFSMLLLVEDK